MIFCLFQVRGTVMNVVGFDCLEVAELARKIAMARSLMNPSINERHAGETVVLMAGPDNCCDKSRRWWFSTPSWRPGSNSWGGVIIECQTRLWA